MLHTSHYLDKNAVSFLSEALYANYRNQPYYEEIAIVCIGTRHYAGDSLGPFVGSQLHKRFAMSELVHVYGTSDSPVHALNLQKMMSHIGKAHSHAYVIAVDACLGQFYKIGTLQLVEEPLQPGVSLNKRLPAIGHIHIKGIVNNYSPLNHKVLEHTSLTFVQKMADVIASILFQACGQIIPELSAKAANKSSSSSLSG